MPRCAGVRGALALLCWTLVACEAAPPEADHSTLHQALSASRAYAAAELPMRHGLGRKESDGWSANTAADRAGHLLYGPYTTDLPQGQHVARFRMMIDNHTDYDERVVNLDVYDATTGRPLCTRAVSRRQFTASHVYQDFSLPFTNTTGHALEFRAWWDDMAFIKVGHVTALTEDRQRNADLMSLLEDVRGSTAHRYDTRDDQGNAMDGLKVVPHPRDGGGYLGVYHSLSDDFHSKLATSEDLLTWHYVRDLEKRSSQPTLVALEHDAFLLVVESDHHDGGGARLLFRYYPSVEALLAGTFSHQFSPPRTLSSCAEGTPHVESVTLAPDIEHSVIELGLHAFKGCRVDRQARGTLVNFRTWTARMAPELDAQVMAAETRPGVRLEGNIGDRDRFTFEGGDYEIIEGQNVYGDFSTWRSYLVDRSSGSLTPLNIQTHRGSKAFANPTVSLMRSPAGKPALVATFFMPSEGSAPGEGGSLLFYTELPDSF